MTDADFVGEVAQRVSVIPTEVKESLISKYNRQRCLDSARYDKESETRSMR